MASSRDRARKLARAKLDRQLARRAAAAKRRRQIQAGVGAALVLALIVVGSAWALGAFDSDPEKKKAAQDVCVWTPQDGGGNTNLKDVGTPATTGLPTAGTRPMTVTTNQGGPITAALNLTAAPCAGASFAHLAGRSFFDNTKCHEITAEGALHCGDPSGTGIGGPTYTFYDENVPVPVPSGSGKPAYPKGTVALVANPPGANGSQFLLFFKDYNPAKPVYPVIGKVTAGLDVLTKIGALPTVDNGSGAKVKPKTDVVIKSLTVGEVADTPAATGASTTTPSATPSAG
ncbi:peptidylprolyl isomerase [Micromonospora sp. R77]|uniref:peptidylprolyl isomerase n=1 Tax=Micromonospora sp. R77 TaxID=2925836 RepID=UPI001F621E2E|nr:peptidylprolyl isomerase [Micromonospora sp. R77]MCI4065421.1 peptidylprolyl isomerase [Micromonospora sp. R77]